MTTNAQIEANRVNAAKSTGPRTAAGKKAAAANSLKHGLLAKAALLPEESEEEFSDLADELLDELQPVGASELLLVDEIINLTWRLRRASLVESGLFVRERAIADEEWFRQRESELELLERDAWPHRMAIQLGQGHPQEVIDIIDEELHAELGREAKKATARRRSDLGQLGEAFARDASSGNAFTKINRYETTIDRRLTRKLAELRLQQETRKGRVDAD